MMFGKNKEIAELQRQISDLSKKVYELQMGIYPLFTEWEHAVPQRKAIQLLMDHLGVKLSHSPENTSLVKTKTK
jgi:hypothetical protein